jgi:hypothetical protein
MSIIIAGCTAFGSTAAAVPLAVVAASVADIAVSSTAAAELAAVMATQKVMCNAVVEQKRQC